MFLKHTKVPAEDKSNITLLFCKLPNYRIIRYIYEQSQIFMKAQNFSTEMP